MTQYREATTNFVKNAKGIAGAIDMLRAAISGGNKDDIRFATDLVASAADSYLGSTETYQKRGVDEIATSAKDTALKQEKLASDLLAGALMDLNVANTIMTAARAAEEQAPNQDPEAVEELDENYERLNGLLNTVSLPLGRSIDSPVVTARFGLDEAPTPMQPSANEATAKANYETQVAEVFTVLVAKSKEVVLTTFESIKGLDFEKLLESLGSLGKILAEVPHVSKLVAKSVAIVVQAMEKISDLLGVGQHLETLRTIARKVVEYLKDPTKPLEELLALSYRADEAKKLVRQLVDKTSAPFSNIDEGTKELVQLRTRFAEQMAFLVQIVGGVTIAKRLVNFFSPEAATLPFFGSFYVLVMSYAVLAGMDFADSTGSLNFVSGVIRISERVLI